MSVPTARHIGYTKVGLRGGVMLLVTTTTILRLMRVGKNLQTRDYMVTTLCLTRRVNKANHVGRVKIARLSPFPSANRGWRSGLITLLTKKANPVWSRGCV